jgi:RHS repeat-associated protein
MTEAENGKTGTDERTRTCVSYDSQGNISSVKMGCDPASSCASCTAPEATYQYDDFGDLVEAGLPWTGSSGDGVTHFKYDARGDLLIKQTPEMSDPKGFPEWLEYTYDGLGRQKERKLDYLHNGLHAEWLVTFAYDEEQPSGCATLTGAKAQGRLSSQEDSFGMTWFKYDAYGRLVAEYRGRNGTCDLGTFPADPDANPNTLYTYNANGDLTSIQYPYGRTVSYVNDIDEGGSSDKVKKVQVKYAKSEDKWSDPATIIENVAWEPYGGLRGYQIDHPGGEQTAVEYAMGEANAAPPATPLGASARDKSGRVRALWVTTGELQLGKPHKDPIYAQQYQWKADQVVESDVWLVDAGSPAIQKYTYDSLTRLAEADGGMGPEGGDAFGKRTYEYDRRGNRTGESRDGVAYTSAYSGNADQVTQWKADGTNNWLQWNYEYGPDGSVKSVKSHDDSSGTQASSIELQAGPMLGGSGTTETTYQSANVNGAVYGYFYDAKGRRRFKQSPTANISNEYFYSPDSNLLIDAAASAIVTLSIPPHVLYKFKVLNEYVWLGGRPVAEIQGDITTRDTGVYHREADACDPSTCGGDGLPILYFPITDELGRPVVVLDKHRRISGVGQYDPFGQVNRVSLDAESGGTNHVYPLGGSAAGTVKQASPSAALKTRLRVKFDMMDLASESDPDCTPLTWANGEDYAYVYNVDGILWTGLSTKGPVWTPYLEADGGVADIGVASDYVNKKVAPLTLCVPQNVSDTAHNGIVASAYEYERHDPAAVAYWPPLRLPGQYHDEETDLNQNWNRFYDPNGGRYWEPEPYWLMPSKVVASARAGMPWPVYGYAGNNPIGLTDSDGLDYSVDHGEARVAFDIMYCHLADGERGLLAALEQDHTVNLHIQMGILSDPGFIGSRGAHQIRHNQSGYCRSHPTGDYEPKYSNPTRDWDVFLNFELMAASNRHHDDEEIPDSLIYHEVFGHFFPETINNHNGGHLDEPHANRIENKYRERVGLSPTYPVDWAMDGLAGLWGNGVSGTRVWSCLFGMLQTARRTGLHPRGGQKR